MEAGLMGSVHSSGSLNLAALDACHSGDGLSQQEIRTTSPDVNFGPQQMTLSSCQIDEGTVQKGKATV